MPTISFAGHHISPVNVMIDPNQKSTSIQVTNSHNYETKFQLIVLKLEYQSGQKVYKPTNDLLVAPRIFTIPSSATQTIRVAIHPKTMYIQEEAGYKLTLKELPNQSNKSSAVQGTVRMVTEFNIPVSIGK